jgi:hypothetical protein
MSGNSMNLPFVQASNREGQELAGLCPSISFSDETSLKGNLLLASALCLEI